MMAFLETLLGLLAVLSFALTLWQWIVARRFPLHRRITDHGFAPGITVLKPLNGCDRETEACLKSWLAHDYSGPVQILFGVASSDDPVLQIVERLIEQSSHADAQLIPCPEPRGANQKISKLIQLLPRAKHDVILVSDADVWVPPDFLTNVVAPLRDPEVGLVNCFYRLANPSTLPMRWEAIAINADFWSQVLQSRSLKPLDFALGAVMVTRREQIEKIGGFSALADYLADDYELGHRIAQRGQRIELCPVVVECHEPPKTWRQAWRHQLRWARTIRVCRPVPYFFSVLGNATLWPLLWVVANPGRGSFIGAAALILWRVFSAQTLQHRLTRTPPRALDSAWVLLKDLLSGLLLGSRLSRRDD